MLPQNKRIPRKMFPLLRRRGKSFKNDIFLMKFVSNPESGSRFSFSVSKKISKSAATRNRLRRSGYILIGRYWADIKTDILAFFSFIKAPKSDEEMEASLRSILKDAKLLQ